MSEGRRSFFTRFSTGLAAFAATAVGAKAVQGQSSGAERWQPLRHEKDDWLDKLPGRHRLVFDTTTPEGLAQAITFANNFLRVNQTDYGLKESDVALVLVVRHRSTSFAYNNAIWGKYGSPISNQANFVDPKTKQAPNINVLTATDYGTALPNRGMTLDALVKQGAQLAVCQLATRNYAGAVARATGGNTDAIYEEITANLLGNARMVPAGIVAVARAQERGYSLVTVY